MLPAKQSQIRFKWDDKKENLIKFVQDFKGTMEFSYSDSNTGKVKMKGSVTYIWIYSFSFILFSYYTFSFLKKRKKDPTELKYNKYLLELHCSFVVKGDLTLLCRKPLSYKNQSIDLESKSIDWFLYDTNLSHERVKMSSFRGAIFVHKLIFRTYLLLNAWNLALSFEHGNYHMVQQIYFKGCTIT